MGRRLHVRCVCVHVRRRARWPSLLLRRRTVDDVSELATLVRVSVHCHHHQFRAINIIYRLDWQSITFGAPASKFYTSGMSKYYLRVYHANSPSLPGTLDISFGVPTHLESRVLNTLRMDLESPLWPDNVINPE